MLDPRFKNRYVTDKEEFVANVIRWINEDCNRGIQDPILRTPSPKRRRALITFFGEANDNSADDDGDSEDLVQSDETETEISAYFKVKCLSLNGNPLDYWKVSAKATDNLITNCK